MKHIAVTVLCVAPGLTSSLDLLISYVMSVRLGHLYPFMPFVSETGNHPPESCVFSALSTFGALSMFVCVWVRNQQVQHYATQQKHLTQRVILKSNKSGYKIGIFCAANLFTLSHFQEINCFAVHTMTAVAFFISSVVYMHIQSFISRHTQLSTPFITQLRGRQAQLQALMVFLMLTLGAMSASSGKPVRDLTPSDNGHLAHAIAAVCEYIGVFNIAAFFLTYLNESRHLSIQLPMVSVDADGQ